MYLPNTKRKRREQPQCWTDCESLFTTTTTSTHHLLQATAVSTSREDLFWERFEKELVQKYWSKPNQKSNNNHRDNRMNDLFRQRIKMGYNVCARALTRYHPTAKSPKALLVVLPSTPEHASLPWNYIPSVCHEQKIPLFFYQGSDDSKLAQLLHLKQVSVLVFVSRAEKGKEEEESSAKDATITKEEEERFHKDVDSFIHFVSNKVPALRLVPRETKAAMKQNS